jgi:DNA polymerase III epsilon subunit-like protein
MKYAFLDLETTGFGPQEDSIIEVSFVITDTDFNEIDRFDEVVIPEKSELTPFITNLTGITPEEIQKNGKRIADLKAAIDEKLIDTVIIGHNINFDINFLLANGIEIKKNERFDTHELSRILLPREASFALEVLSQKYGFLHKDAHRAMSDVEASLDLFRLLQDKIQQLPKVFLEDISAFLEQKTTWFARHLFLKAHKEPVSVVQNSTNNVSKNSESPLKETVSNTKIVESWWKTIEPKLEVVTPECTGFIAQGDSVISAQLALKIAEESEIPSLIITPKLKFFSEVTPVPTPEVLLDPERLSAFVDSRKILDNEATTFYLKCAYRHFLGFRGQVFFDLFFKERNWWPEICVQDETHPIFQDAVNKRQGTKVLSCTPATFLRFRHLPLFKERQLLIDEGEVFARECLFAPSENYSLQSWLNHTEENISVATQFAIKTICQDIIEAKLQHAITPFPQRVRLHPADSYEDIAEQIRTIAPDKKLEQIATILAEPRDKLTRWINYFPESGNCTIGQWHPDDWRELKEDLRQRKKIIFYRHKLTSNDAFFRVFLGTNQVQKISAHPESLYQGKLKIPRDLPSGNAPEYLDFINDYILKTAKQDFKEGEENGLIANFSSQETLRKICAKLAEHMPGTGYKLLGEKFSGGDEKVLNLIRNNDQICLATQKITHPFLATQPWRTILIQKFPFDPPHPLLETIEEVMKNSGQNFWALWIEPQVTANLARRISTFYNAENMIILDPRHNAKWGKSILQSAFPHLKIEYI